MKKLNRICILALTLLLCTACSGKSDDSSKTKDKNETGVKVEESVISFANMKIDNPDLKLTDSQIEVLKYFDTDYLSVNNYDNLQRYPKIYENSQISFNGIVQKVIKSDDKEYELLVEMNGNPSSDGKTSLVFIKGKQQEPRIIEKDWLKFYGRYKGVKTQDVDGTSKTLPLVTVNKTTQYGVAGEEPRYDISTIKTVANAIFGKDIKIKQAVCDEDYKLDALHSPQEQYYIVTPDNQANANFKKFEMGSRTPMIRNADNTKSNIILFDVAADFEHYIVSNYDKNTKLMYLEYYDKDFKKIWSREFENVDSLPYDYTANEIYLIADNDLFILDAKTGENKIEPVMVGEKTKISMLNDGAILIGTGNKDNVMKVDKEGKIVWKTSVDIEVKRCAGLQIVDGNVVAFLESYTVDNPKDAYSSISNYSSKIAAIDSKGKVIQEFSEVNNDSANTGQQGDSDVSSVESSVGDDGESQCMYYDPKKDVTYMLDGTPVPGNHCGALD